MAPTPIKRDVLEYTIGWVTALEIELAAATALLDEEHQEPNNFERGHHDYNVYTWGRISGHNIVLVSLPEGRYGLTSAATTVERLLSSLSHIKVGLLVGIGAAIPECGLDIRLGDVAVSRLDADNSGVLQYDFGKEKDDGFQRIGMLAQPPDVLLNAMSSLRASHEIKGSAVSSILESAGQHHPRFAQKFGHPGQDKDHLYSRDDIALPSTEHEVSRISRASSEPEIHYGTIISGNRLVKNAATRRRIASFVGQRCICLEMEAAGVMNNFPSLVIRGISDYADAHKNDDWHRYAAATASAFAKELLTYVPKTDFKQFVIRVQSNGLESANRAAEQRLQQQNVSKFLRSLYIFPYEERKNRNPPRTSGTCEWFLAHSKFEAWTNHVPASTTTINGLGDSTLSSSQVLIKHQEHGSILLVTADPGCGKSVLARCLVDEILPTEYRIICYFFFKDDAPDQSTALAAIKAILHQLISSDETAFTTVVNKHLDSFGDKISASFFSLWKVFLDCIDIEEREVICVCDGLDECKETDRKQLLDAIKASTISHTNIKYLLLSRPYFHVQRTLTSDANHPPVIHLSGDNTDERDMISEEIDLVIRTRIDQLCEERGLNEDDRSFLLAQFQSSPQRTYLWAHLTLAIIENNPGFTRGNAREVCGHISPTVDAAYQRILDRSTDKMKTLRILMLIISAQRPLRVTDIGILLALEHSHTKVSQLDELLEPPNRLQTTLRNFCGFFVMISEHHVYLLHQTARDFLLTHTSIGSNTVIETWKQYERTHSAQSTPNWSNSISLSNAHRTMLVLSRILLALTQDIQPDRRVSDLVYYCNSNWLKHMRHAEIEYTDPVLDWMFAIPARKSRWFDIMQTAIGSAIEADDDTAIIQLQIGASLGLDNLVKRALLVTCSEAPTYEKLNSAIRAAFSARSAKTLRVLLSCVTHAPSIGSLDTFRRKILAIENADHERSLTRSRLTDVEPAAPNELLNDLTRALNIAVKEADMEMLKLLLKYGADVNQVNGQEETPLHHASNTATIRVLLEAGADINARDRMGYIPLIHHFKRHHEAHQCEEIHTLLWTGQVEDLHRHYKTQYDLDSLDEAHGSTPLHLILSNHGGQCIRCIEFLLHYGVDVRALDSDGWSPLQCARLTRNTEAIKLLLASGAEDPQDNTKGIEEVGEEEDATPPEPQTLHDAISAGSSIFHIRELLKRTADVNATNLDGRTAIHCAVCYRAGYEMIKLLIEHGVQINKIDSAGRSPIHHAIDLNAEPDIVKLLLKCGGDANIVDFNLETALMLAIKKGHDVEMLKLLLRYGARAHISNYKGMSYLHFANTGESIDILVSAGAAVDAPTSSEQETALHRACATKRFDKHTLSIVRALLKHGADPQKARKDGLSALDLVRRRLPHKVNADASETISGSSEELSMLQTCLDMFIHMDASSIKGATKSRRLPSLKVDTKSRSYSKKEMSQGVKLDTSSSSDSDMSFTTAIEPREEEEIDWELD